MTPALRRALYCSRNLPHMYGDMIAALLTLTGGKRRDGSTVFRLR